MENESRFKKSVLNARVNMLFYFLALLLSFFSRKIWLDRLGDEFIGLTGTLSNLLNMLNLAELGIGAAVGYMLYKPLAEKNQETINEIISVYGFFYRRVGQLILCLGLIMGACLPLIFPNTEVGLSVVYFAFFTYLANALISYFCNYKQMLLNADQKQYVVTAYNQSAQLLAIIVQMVLVLYTGNPFLWLSISLITGVTYAIILEWKIRQVYPWLQAEVKRGKILYKKYPDVMKYTKQIFIHRVATLVQNQSAPLFVYAFVSLKHVAYYANYTLIVDKVSQLLIQFMGSTSAGVGNLVAHGDKKRIQSVYWELMSLRFFISGVVCFGMLLFIEPFIKLWLGQEYILEPIVLYLLMGCTFIRFTRDATDQFLNAYGLFYDVWAPFVETIINIVVTIIAGHFWGLPGIILGNIVSLTCIVLLWKPYFLFSRGFKLSVWNYWKNYLIYVLIVGGSIVLGYWGYQKSGIDSSASFLVLVRDAILLTIVYAVAIYALLYIFTPGTRAFAGRVWAMTPFNKH